MHVRSCCFANQNLLLVCLLVFSFDALVAVRVVGS